MMIEEEEEEEEKGEGQEAPDEEEEHEAVEEEGRNMGHLSGRRVAPKNDLYRDLRRFLHHSPPHSLP